MHARTHKRIQESIDYQSDIGRGKMSDVVCRLVELHAVGKVTNEEVKDLRVE